MRVRRSLEEKLGVEETSFLMDRPPGGWSDLVTNRTLDLKFETLDHRFEAIGHRFDALDHRFEALESRMLAEMERRFADLAWKMITALISSMVLLSAIFGALLAASGS
jgi:hypothetical protein